MLKTRDVASDAVKGPQGAWERVRLAIIRRKNDLGMSNRDFGRGFSANHGKGHGDQWVSNLLNPKMPNKLSLLELDEAASILKTSAAALVKSPYETAEYLTPTEHRIITAMRAVPASIRDHFLTLAEYLIGVAPQEIDLLMEYRELTREEQTRIQHWIHVTRLAPAPMPGLRVLPDQPETDAPPTAAARHSRDQRKTKR